MSAKLWKKKGSPIAVLVRSNDIHKCICFVKLFRLEIERIRDMPEDEKQAWLEANPKVPCFDAHAHSLQRVINQADKSDYKFLQKYYHRGVFYLDKACCAGLVPASVAIAPPVVDADADGAGR